MVQESGQNIEHGDCFIENTTDVHKVAHKISKGRKVLDSKNLQQLEEHWQWTTLKCKEDLVIDREHSDVQEKVDEPPANAPPKKESVTNHIESTVEQSTSDPPRLASSTLITHSPIVPIEEICYTEEFPKVMKRIVSGSNSKCAVEIPKLEMTKVKEIALQAKLGGGTYVCQECQVAATSRNEIGFSRRYPCLLFFCIFLNVMSILSFLFCISVLRNMFPNPAY